MEAEKSSVKRLVINFLVLGGVSDDLKPLRGVAPFPVLVIVGGQKECGCLHEFPGFPRGGCGFETGAAGFVLADLAIGHAEEIPRFDCFLIAGKGPQELVKFLCGNPVVPFSLPGVLFVPCVVVIQGGKIVKITGRIDPEGVLVLIRLLSRRGKRQPD